MHTRRFSLLIFNLIILLKINCNAWVIPMEKYISNEDLVNALTAEEDDTEFGAEASQVEDHLDVMGIKIVKFTRQDPVMKIFDYDTGLARKFVSKQWQKLLSEYEPALELDIKVVTVTVPSVRDEVKDVVTKSPKTEKQTNLANDISTTDTDVRGKLMNRPVTVKLEHDQDEDVQQHSGLK